MFGNEEEGCEREAGSHSRAKSDAPVDIISSVTWADSSLEMPLTCSFIFSKNILPGSQVQVPLLARGLSKH